ncbi:MAG TPA: amino acid ABC transporter substrate-binding protein [Candidatus Elarobacter sp.]|jgi:branched-chain amino acid transport system substrate-binding protein|nr:amino acid ABC transporter substrate-binding protein [Candidatus Elarobacter sp.]
MTTHRLRTFFAAIALVAVPFVSVVPARGADTIKIGFSVSETGSLAAPAIFQRQGYELAADEQNAHGGLLGKKIELVHYDDQSTPSTAVSLYEKLLTDDKVDLVMGPYSSQVTSAVAPVIDRAKMTMPSMDANPQPYDGSHPYLVQTIAQTGQYMAPVVDFAARHGVKTIAVLNQNSPFPQELARGIKAEAAKHNLTVVFEEAYPPSTTDFGPLVLKAAAANPDAVICGTFLADAEGIVRAAKAQNMKAKMFAFSVGPVEPEFGSALGSAANGIFGNTLWFPTLKTAGNAEFVKSFHAKYGRDPDYHAALSYAAMKLVIQAVQAVGSIDQDKIRAWLHGHTVETVMGPFKVSPTGLQIGYSAYVLQWQNGKQLLVWPQSNANGSPVYPHPGW